MKLRPYLLLISLISPLIVIGLLVWQFITLFDLHSNARTYPQFKDDFLLMALILVTGFFLIALTTASYVEKKIQRSLLSIKTLLLQIIEGNELPQKVFKQIPQGMANIFLQIKEHLTEREKSYDQKTQESFQKEKMEALSQLGVGMAHEINNPLAAILGHAQLAKSKSSDLAVHSHLNIIEKEIRKVKEFARDLMKFSGDATIEGTPLNVKKVILDSIDLMQSELDSRGIQIERHLTSTQEAHIDANKLQQVFVNLIQNAISAMEKSSQKTLSFHSKDIKDGIRVEVKDTGSGIPPEVKDKIFQPFFTSKASQGGKGIGLSISFGIIKGHDGHISAESQVGQGTTFLIDIPSHKPTTSNKEHPQDLQPSAPAPAGQTDGTPPDSHIPGSTHTRLTHK